MARQFILGVCIAFAASACAAPADSPSRPLRKDITLPLEVERIAAVVPADATLDGLLRQHRLSAALVVAAVESARQVFDPRDLRADRPYRLVRSVDGFLREFEYEIDADRLLRIVNRHRNEPERLEAVVLPIQKDSAVVAIRGHIDAATPSIIAAMDQAGERVQLAMAMADIFTGQVDFEGDLQPGDSFELLFEKFTRGGEFAGYGQILGARLLNDGDDHRAFRWVDKGTGKASYYDEQGRSLKRAILRSPLRFEPRVTSGFSRRRLHPVHRTYRAHLGVDYGAPHGAAVVAVADGSVVSAGWAGGGGNQVRLKHAAGMETYYLHLSRFAKGLRGGSRVSQGQVIGYVGSTGTATGAHLDYRFKRNGVFVNPLAEHRRQPPGAPIPSVHLAGFHRARNATLTQMSSILLAEAPRRKPDAVKAIQ